MSASHLPRSAPALDRPAREAWSRLHHIVHSGERRAALLALLTDPDNDRERRAWQEETRGIPACEEWRQTIQCLPASARLPALDMLLRAAASAPLAERQALLLSARRLMSADGTVSALDRLRWLTLRHRLSGHVTLRQLSHAHDDNELEDLPVALLLAMSQFTAYLARLVPHPSPDVAVSAFGSLWHDTVMRSLWPSSVVPPTCTLPDPDTLGRALQTLQHTLGWLHRPVLARLWVDAAQTRPGLLVSHDEPLPIGAQALWLACALLDTPMPPALAYHFIDTEVLEPTLSLL